MTLDRRGFLKAAGAFSILFPAGLMAVGTARADQNTSSPITPTCSREGLQKRIQAHFGAGFQLLDYSQSGASTLARIEHLENHFLVVSDDLIHWETLSSTVS